MFPRSILLLLLFCRFGGRAELFQCKGKNAVIPAILWIVIDSLILAYFHIYIFHFVAGISRSLTLYIVQFHTCNYDHVYMIISSTNTVAAINSYDKLLSDDLASFDMWGFLNCWCDVICVSSDRHISTIVHINCDWNKIKQKNIESHLS